MRSIIKSQSENIMNHTLSFNNNQNYLNMEAPPDKEQFTEETNIPLNNQNFMKSRIFTEALSEQTSNYIQQKIMSSPSEAEQLKKLDLRHMCNTVVNELEVVEKQAAYDYIKVSEDLQTLGEELLAADGIMEELENVLFGFKDHLESIKYEMTSLQEKSNKMNTTLTNKKKVQTFLNNFIESAVLDKELIDAICLSQIDEHYVKHIQSLLAKLNSLNNNSISNDSKAYKQLQPELEKLKAKASSRLREFLLEQFSQLKKSKTNLQIIQKNILMKYKIFLKFFKDNYPSIFTELCNSYREILAKYYVNNYKIYLAEIYKLQIELYKKTDLILQPETDKLRLYLPEIKPTNLNQQKKSIFYLMNRDKNVLHKEDRNGDVILYSVAQQSGQKYTIEQVFKSVNKVFMDGVMNQMIFTAEFFNLKSEGAVELFGPLFRPSQNIFLDQLKSTVNNTFDIFGLLLIMGINENNKKIFQQNQCSAIDFYFDQINIIILSRFEYLFDQHLKIIRDLGVLEFRKLEKAVNSKILIERFSDFLTSFYRLYYHTQSQMILVRLESIRKSFFDLALRVSKEYESEAVGKTYYLNVLQPIYHSLIIDPIVSKSEQFHKDKEKIEIMIMQYGNTIVLSQIKESFPSVCGTMKKYANEGEEYLNNQQGSCSLVGEIQKDQIQAILLDIDQKTIINKFQKVLSNCDQTYSGYTLKIILKKFTKLFLKFYGEIYKYLKNNKSESINNLLQPHSMMKQINNVFSKHTI